MRTYKVFSQLCVLLIAATLASPRASNATEPSVKARDILPANFFRSVHYEIDDQVSLNGYFYHFTVSSDFGIYKVSSIPMLRMRLHEIVTIADVMPQLNKSGFTIDRSPPGRRGVAEDSVADILSNPIGTAGRLLDNVRFNLEETFVEQTRPIEGTTISSGTQTAAHDPEPHKRSAAAQLGVDVYTSNVAVQTVLDQLARARSAGKLRQSIAPAQTPLVRPSPFGSGVLDSRIRSRLKNSSAAQVNEHVSELLEAAGVDATTRIALITHQQFTPQTRLYFASYLSLLNQVENVDGLVSVAITATTEADVLAFVNLARITAFSHLQGNAVQRIILVKHLATFATKNQELVLPLPVDFFEWSETSDKLFNDLIDTASQQDLESLSVLVAGELGDNARLELTDRDIAYQTQYSY